VDFSVRKNSEPISKEQSRSIDAKRKQLDIQRKKLVKTLSIQELQ